jgi:hypothetical protein
MINDKVKRIYIKLLYYFEKKIPVHINSGFGYRNGIIIDITKSILIIQDKIKGETQVFLEEIYEDSISRYREVSD